MMNRLFIVLFALICSDLAVSATDFEQHEVIVEYQQQKLGGTLLLPSQRKSDTLVVMTSGSGPQDRDETLDGFRIFKVLAEHLAQQGIGLS
jgi:molybdopterin biosynthesis enzyme MoaB